MKEQFMAKKPAREGTPLKLVEPEDLFNRMREAYDAIARRAFEIFENNGRWPGRDLEDWFKAESELLRSIRLQVGESEDTLSVWAEVPGFGTDELEVSVEPRRLTISGKKRTDRECKESGNVVYSELRSNELLRVFDLPGEVDPSRATATLKDGILELRMPRAVKPQKIRVEAKAA